MKAFGLYLEGILHPLLRCCVIILLNTSQIGGQAFVDLLLVVQLGNLVPEISGRCLLLRFQFVDPGLNIGCVHELLSLQLVDLVGNLVDPVGQLRPVKRYEQLTGIDQLPRHHMNLSHFNRLFRVDDNLSCLGNTEESGPIRSVITGHHDKGHHTTNHTI